ncbi:MAG TPA: 4-alpha-glucanotransferase [Pyrinomonadaceae bacterium]
MKRPLTVSFPRASGVLLHPTSLPGPLGVGDLGREARRFADFLADAGQTLWQVLPLGPTGYADSPYQSFSAHAGNALLVSPDLLVEDGLLDKADLEPAPQFDPDRADYGAAIEFKGRLHARAFENFRGGRGAALRADFDEFREREAGWLEDYALFRALKSERGEVSWAEWERSLVRREPGALAAARERLRDRIEAQRFRQFLFFRQWRALRAYCRERGIKIVGDIPIFVAHDSSDVWARPDLFKLDERGRPRVVAGVPPDYFSRTGQLWGNPLYEWDAHLAEGFAWWIERFRGTLKVVDILRVDHFRGFAAAWEIPAGDKTAERGSWVGAPGRQLFGAVREALGELPIIAEDLGVITPDVEELRDRFGFPSMRIMQFGFNEPPHLPHNYARNMCVYTGTHDNDTTAGWFNSEAGVGSTRTGEQIERERRSALDYLASDGREINWDFIRAVFASVADTAIVPAQDILGLGSEARMNLPATTSGNWAWRFRAGALTREHAARLRHFSELYERNVAAAPPRAGSVPEGD